MNTKLNQIYRCKICGNIVEVVHPGADSLICCGEKMELVVENSVDASREKHVPQVEKEGDGVVIKVGTVPHPMEEAHYIEWIEIVFDGKVDRQYLQPGMKPKARFNVSADDLIARAYCNLHGLWVSK